MIVRLNSEKEVEGFRLRTDVDVLSVVPQNNRFLVVYGPKRPNTFNGQIKLNH
jgi:phosphotransferase system IIB component